MARSTVKELLALERRGVSWSRNRNFDLFAAGAPRRARALRLRLQALFRFAEEHQHHALQVELHRGRGRYPFEIQLTCRANASRFTACLAADEMPLLRRSPVLSALLAEARPRRR